MRPNKFAILLTLVILATACSPTRRLTEGQYLLIKNEVIEAEKLPKKERDDISDYALPKTNKKFLGFWRFYLQIYNLPNPDKLAKNKEKQLMRLNQKNQKIIEYNSQITNPKKKKKKLKKEKLLFGEWLQKNGEAPVLLDSFKIQKSKKLLTGYAKNKGYFRAYVNDSVVFLKKKKAKVIYTIHRGPAYYLDTLIYKINNLNISYYIEANKSKSKLDPKMKYDLQKFDDERTRITDILKNHGYYLFIEDNIKYEADTVSVPGKIRLTMRLKNTAYDHVKGEDTVHVDPFKKFRINQIIVKPNFQIDPNNITSVDTIQYKEYTFIFYNKVNYNPKILAHSIFFEKGEYYDAQDEVRTKRALADLRNFKFINISFDPIYTDNKDDQLNVIVDLSPVPKQSFGVEVQGTTSGFQYPGVNLSLSYANKNLFKGADWFEISTYAGADVQLVQGDTAGNPPPRNILGIFNTIEVGVQVSLKFNKFLFPIKVDKVKKWMKPRTKISLGFNWQQRLDYTRYVASANFGYGWSSSQKLKHQLNPAEISFVFLDKTQAFEDFLQTVNDQFVKNTFIPHYIQGASYTITWNTQDFAHKDKNFVFLKGNLQWAGNIPYAVAKIVEPNTPPQGYYSIFNDIRFAQYIRAEIDFRYFANLHANHRLAFRGNVGLGIPYGNTQIMPFDKAFSIGGSNDLRAWLPRAMGPGTYLDANVTRVDQVGDIKMLFSTEYRVKLYRFIEGALFADFGNVWLVRDDIDRPGGAITPNFIKEFALGAGAGLRLNFGFFIFRFDVAFPLRDPRYVDDWVIKNLQGSDVRYNIAVGYPF